MNESLLALAAIITAVATFIPATVAALNSIHAKREAVAAKEVAVVATEVARTTADEVHHQLTTLTLNVDGRLTQLLDEVRASATLRGREEGAEAERLRRQPPPDP